MASRAEKRWTALLGAISLVSITTWLLPEWPVHELLKYQLVATVLGFFLGWKAAQRFGSANTTVNYTLYRGRKRVYEGITYFKRFPKRMQEHRKAGKRFTHVRIGRPRPRKEALSIERKRIKRFRPRYNVLHND